MLVFQSFTVKTTQTSKTISKFSTSLTFLTSKCLLKPISVLNVIGLCDHDKKGCSVMVVSHGSTGPVKHGILQREYREAVKEGRDIDWCCKFCTHAVDSAISTNEALRSLTMLNSNLSF